MKEIIGIDFDGTCVWMWMILCINIITDNENKKDRMIIAYPSIIM